MAFKDKQRVTDATQLPFKHICYAGLTTSPGELLRAGWECKAQLWKGSSFDGRRVPRDKYIFRYPDTKMLIVVKLQRGRVYDLVPASYMIQEHNQHKKPPKIFEEVELTKEDIPLLYEILEGLNHDTYKKYLKDKPKKIDNVINIEDYLKDREGNDYIQIQTLRD